MQENSFFASKVDKLDGLTNVYRREVMYEYIEYLIDNNKPFSYAILDVDNFKYINDSHGHLFGDVVLQNIALQLINVVKDDNGVIGRYGGDEFMIIYEGIENYDDQWQKCFNLLKSTKPIDYEDICDFSWTYTIGMSKFPQDAKNFNDLLDLADKALYRGKTKGRNCFIIYLEEKHKDILLLSERDRVYSPIYLQNKVFQELTRKNTDINKNINNILSFIGSHMMLEQICIEYNDTIINAYSHPLAEGIEIKVLGTNLIKEHVRDNVGYFYENTTKDSRFRQYDPLYSKMIEYGIEATVIIELKAYGNSYGYLRADMVLPGTGRIWQQNDLVVLTTLAQTIALVKYINEKSS